MLSPEKPQLLLLRVLERSLSNGLDSGMVPPPRPAGNRCLVSFIYFYHLLSTFHALEIEPFLRLSSYLKLFTKRKRLPGDGGARL